MTHPTTPATVAIDVRQAIYANLEALSTLLDDYRCFYGRASERTAARAFLQAGFEYGQSVVFMAHDDATHPALSELLVGTDEAGKQLKAVDAKKGATYRVIKGY